MTNPCIRPQPSRTIFLFAMWSTVCLFTVSAESTTTALNNLASEYGLATDATSSCKQVESNLGDVYQLAFDYGLNVTNLVDTLLPEIARYFKVELPDQLQDCDNLENDSAACDAYRAEKACAQAAQISLQQVADFFSVHYNETISPRPCSELRTGLDAVYLMGCAFNPKFKQLEFKGSDSGECQSFPCIHGECSDLPSAYVCTCASGWVGRNCELAAMECQSSPCDNGGTCVDKVGVYECACAPGYTGVNCITDINECGSKPCQNGGTCQQGEGVYSCDCSRGIVGVNCEVSLLTTSVKLISFENVDECSSHPCSHEGICKDLALSYSCMCTGGYTGVNCESDINECHSQPCLNGATCTDAVAHYVCTCADGFTGSSNLVPTFEGSHHRHVESNCETNINECATSPCQNGGTCVDGVGAFTCNCGTGFSGVSCGTQVQRCTKSENACDQDNAVCTKDSSVKCTCFPGYESIDSGRSCTAVDECSSAPCQNDGVCTDLGAIYGCECQPGFAGVHCESDIDECAVLPCQNGAICMQGVGTFACVCAAGWSGASCNEDMNECVSVPCQRGTCIDGVNTWACECPPGYADVVCGTNLDECASQPCLNGANCVDSIESFRCDCPFGFSGDMCQEHTLSKISQFYEIDSAVGSCDNLETHLSMFNHLSCSLQKRSDCSDIGDTARFYGVPHAEGGAVSSSELASDMHDVNLIACSLNVKPVGSSACGCSPGVSGVACDVDIDECASFPCVHGTCTDGLNHLKLNSYDCACEDGWTGFDCADEESVCSSEPCMNAGTCIDHEGSFTCSCPSGYKGLHCDINTSECASLPCKNGGACTDGANSYTCDCSAG